MILVSGNILQAKHPLENPSKVQQSERRLYEGIVDRQANLVNRSLFYVLGSRGTSITSEDEMSRGIAGCVVLRGGAKIYHDVRTPRR